MKALPTGLEAHLASAATTLCWCWRLTRRDGVTLGFTDHDHALSFEATQFEAAAGFTASEIRDSVGLSVDNLDVTGAITSERLAEADLAAGLYDDAKVEIFRVNWQDPNERVLMRSGSLGEVKRAAGTFVAEVRGLAHYLQQPKGRVYQYACDADAGDGRCRVDLTSPSFRATGTVSSVGGDRKLTAAGLSGYASDWFTQGLVTFTSGAASGQRIEVKSHTSLGGIVTLELWQGAREPLTIGQTFTITAGCDKSIGTCRSKFDNAVNFRGFPHMPGNDFVATVHRPGGKS